MSIYHTRTLPTVNILFQLSIKCTTNSISNDEVKFNVRLLLEQAKILCKSVNISDSCFDWFRLLSYPRCIGILCV